MEISGESLQGVAVVGGGQLSIVVNGDLCWYICHYPKMLLIHQLWSGKCMFNVSSREAKLLYVSNLLFFFLFLFSLFLSCSCFPFFFKGVGCVGF